MEEYSIIIIYIVLSIKICQQKKKCYYYRYFKDVRNGEAAAPDHNSTMTVTI